MTSSELIVAIDFGTTYSGIAHFLKETDVGDDAEVIDEKIVVVQQWPGDVIHEKTPTILAYDADTVRWGYDVRHEDQPQYTRFKLALEAEPTVSEHYLSKPADGHTSVLSKFKIGRRRDSYIDPVHLATDYLTQLYNYFLLRVINMNAMENVPRSYVITVPAIWSDRGKYLTKQAAFRAGITEGNLSLITEPEAAGLYCGLLCSKDVVILGPGDRYLICDAGGGTVV
jgi:molecular chaperone DnaK (HSP70)